MATVPIAYATVDRRSRIDDLYAKCAFGSGVMLVLMEAIYLLSSHPAFFRPSWGVMTDPIGRDFVNV